MLFCKYVYTICYFFAKGRVSLEWNELAENTLDFQEMYFTAGLKWTQQEMHIYMIIYVKQGELRLSVEDEQFVAQPGEIMFVPEGPASITYHYFGSPYHGLTLRFRSFPNVEYYEYPPQVVKIDRATQQAFEDIPCELPLCTEKLWRFYKALSLTQPFLQPIKQKYMDIVDEAMAYMSTHDHYSIAQLAKLCCVSESGFRAIFQKVTGYTVIEMKHRLQAYKAEILLRTTNYTIDEVADRVGFSSTRHFRKIFKKRYHTSPDQLRRKQQTRHTLFAPPPKKPTE